MVVGGQFPERRKPSSNDYEWVGPWEIKVQMEGGTLLGAER